MNSINDLVRPNIRLLEPYSSARDEFSGTEGVFLDANENPFGNLNRYPDPNQTELKKAIADLKNIPAENIFIGNGSDEPIDLLFRIFCTPEKDRILLCPPTYGMYEVAANINAIEALRIPLTNDFQLNLEAIKRVNDAEQIKLIFLCSPNNPTGNTLNDVETVLQFFKGIVVVDEAYIDFSSNPSFIEKLSVYPNLVILQTFSKAWGLASVRVGMAYASTEVISLMNKVKPPYNVSKLNQDAALEALKNSATIQAQTETIITERKTLEQALAKLSCVRKIYPSDANFCLVEVDNAPALYTYLIERNIITRNRHSVVNNCIRITIGTATENQRLIDALNTYENEKSTIY